MILHKTNLMMEQENLPTLLEFKRIANLRGLLNQKEFDDYMREEKGAMGEKLVYDFLETEGAEDWTIVQNLWLNDGAPFECDSLLFTNHGIHTFEIKHYAGRFTYKNGSCNIGNIKMENDCVQQARKSFLKLHRVCKATFPRLAVNGALIFSSNKNKVIIESPVEDILVFEMPDLYEYIQRIKQHERNNPYSSIDTQQIIQHLEQYEIQNPFYPKAISTDQMKKARKGICCAMCRSFDVSFSKHYVDCPCGYHESREEAIVRSACEYGVLTYDRNFSTGDILDFIDHQGSRYFVQQTLAKHFKHIIKQKHSHYLNLQSDYSKIYSNFKYKKPSYYTSKEYPAHIQFLF